jgi:hydroxymethylbilane synthase
MSVECRILGTRQSQLALWQAHHVAQLLSEAHPQLHTQIKGILSTGDKNLEIALSAFSEKGVFTKELDSALLEGEIDFAVHSMKDLPTKLPEGIVLAAVPLRGDVRDALVLPKPHTQDKQVRNIASSSLRRRAMLMHMHNGNINTSHIRGNVNSRLKKLDEGQFDALVLACAGLERLGLADRISQRLEGALWDYYAVCQGALAVVCRDNDQRMIELLQALNHAQTRIQCSAERAMLRALEGGCKVPIGVKSTQNELKELTLKGIVLTVDGDKTIEYEETVKLSGDYKTDLELAERLGEKVAKELLGRGADKILHDIRMSLENS